MRDLSSLSGFPAALFTFRCRAKTGALPELALGRQEQDDGAFVWRCLTALLARGYTPGSIYTDVMMNGRGFPAPEIRQMSLFDEGLTPSHVYEPNVESVSAGSLDRAYDAEHFFDESMCGTYGHLPGIVVSPLAATLLLGSVSVVFFVYEGPRILVSQRLTPFLDCLEKGLKPFNDTFSGQLLPKLAMLRALAKKPRTLNSVELIDARGLQCVCYQAR